MKAVLVALCAAAGFAVGVVTRPTILGIQVPMDVLSSDNRFDAEPKAMLMSHLGMMTGIGLLCGVVLAVLVMALTKRQSA